jgi:cytochrome d ubiquinol oxidase subunit I
MPFIGHWQALVVAEHQPVKMAAFETVTTTGANAPLYLFGWVGENDEGQPEATGLAIPGGLSLMLGLSTGRVVQGLDAAAPQDRPPLQLTFQSYHLMIALGFLFILVFFVTLVMHRLRRLERARWLLWALMACIPLSILAINLGWMAAEVGRQPWVVQGLMRTSDAVSPLVSAGQIWMTIGLFVLVYLVLFVAWLRIFLGIIRKGPEDTAEMLEAETAAAGPGPAPAGAGR